MTAASSKPTASIGFLTVIESAGVGLIGGYLLLNPAGRPLEFHCTAPVQTNRTQEILYGPTLKPYLFGEQIGQTLLNKSKLTPVAVCTDCQAALAVRQFASVPVVLVADGERSFSLGVNRVQAAGSFSGDESLIRGTWPPEADHLDLVEPFTRIREALNEALAPTRQAA
jgi:hypothetical protein